jgi:protein tyrosine/serine phosphatase
VARRPWHDPWQWWLWLSGLVGSRYDGLRHFAVVRPGMLLRCGQPHVRDLDRVRREHGLKLIICARGGTRHPLRGAWFRRERAWCERNGVRLEHMPFSDAATPPADVIDRFVALVRDEAHRPVLVHCEQGFHRTGILCAAFRIAVERWPLDRAVAEMERLGFQMDRHKRMPLLRALQEWAARQGLTGGPALAPAPSSE